MSEPHVYIPCVRDGNSGLTERAPELFVPVRVWGTDCVVDIGNPPMGAEYAAASLFVARPRPGQANLRSPKAPGGAIPVSDIGGITRSVIAWLEAAPDVELFVAVDGLRVRHSSRDFSPGLIIAGTDFAEVVLMPGTGDEPSRRIARGWCESVNRLAPELRGFRTWQVSLLDRGAIVDL